MSVTQTPELVDVMMGDHCEWCGYPFDNHDRGYLVDVDDKLGAVACSVTCLENLGGVS